MIFTLWVKVELNYTYWGLALASTSVLWILINRILAFSLRCIPSICLVVKLVPNIQEFRFLLLNMCYLSFTESIWRLAPDWLLFTSCLLFHKFTKTHICCDRLSQRNRWSFWFIFHGSSCPVFWMSTGWLRLSQRRSCVWHTYNYWQFGPFPGPTKFTFAILWAYNCVMTLIPRRTFQKFNFIHIYL